MTEKTETAAAAGEHVTPPIVVNLGKVTRKRAKALKRARGPLMNDVADAIEEVVHGLGEEAKGKQIIPVVLIYREKDKKKGGGGAFRLPFGF